MVLVFADSKFFKNVTLRIARETYIIKVLFRYLPNLAGWSPEYGPWSSCFSTILFYIMLKCIYRVLFVWKCGPKCQKNLIRPADEKNCPSLVYSMYFHKFTKYRLSQNTNNRLYEGSISPFHPRSCKRVILFIGKFQELFTLSSSLNMMEKKLDKKIGSVFFSI